MTECAHEKQTKHENGTITCDACGTHIYELKKVSPEEFGFVVARRVVGIFVDEADHKQALEYIDKEEQKLKEGFES